jgi:hypothetical protein
MISSSYVPNWIASYNTLEQEDLIFNWGIFQKSQISALYLDNYGDSMTEIMIYFGLFLLACLFTISPKIDNLIHSCGGKVYLTLYQRESQFCGFY